MNSHFLRRAALAIAASALFGPTAHAAIPLSTTTAATQNFDTIGVTATATLPTDFKADKVATVRTVGTYAAAGTATTATGGNTLSSSASNGIYNFGAGPAATATDRAVGFLSSGSATQSGNLYAQYVNSTGSALSGVKVSFDVEKYRDGTNVAGTAIQLYYSLDGTTFTSAGAAFLVKFNADGDSNGFASAPGATVSITNQTLAVTIPNNGNLYLAWNYSVASGTTTSSVQALGVDNISVLGQATVASPPAVTGAAFTPSTSSGGQNVTLNATVTPGTNAVSSVTADLSSIGGSSTAALTLVSGNNYNLTYTLPAVVGGGVKSIVVTAKDAQNNQGQATATLTINVPLFTVAQARANTPATGSLGTVQVQGIVTSITAGNAYIEDADGNAGITVFDNSTVDGTAPLVLGQNVTITGALSTFGNEDELIVSNGNLVEGTNLTTNSSGNTLPAVKTLSIPTVTGNDTYEGQLVRFQNLTVITAPTAISAGGTSTTIVAKDVFGNQIAVYLGRNATAGSTLPYPGVPTTPIPATVVGTGISGTVTFTVKPGDIITVAGSLGERSSPTPVKVVRPRDGVDFQIVGLSLPATAAPAGAVHSAPTVYSNVAYFGSDDGKIYAYNTLTGAAINGPSVTTGYLFDAKAYLTANQPGYAGTPKILGRPALHFSSGTPFLYFTTSDGYVFSIDTTGGVNWVTTDPDTGNPVPLVAGATNVRTTPAILTDAGGATFVYVAEATGVTAGNSAVVFKLFDTDGSIAAQSSGLGDYVSSSPSVGAASLYIGTTSGVYRLNPSSLTTMAQLVAGESASGSPFIYTSGATTGNTLAFPVAYTATNNGNVYAQNATTGAPLAGFASAGQPDGKAAVSSAGFSSPFVYGGTLYVGDADNQVYAVNAFSGSNSLFFDANAAGGGSGAIVGGVGVDPAGSGGAGTLVFGSTDANAYFVSLSNPASYVIRSTTGAIETAPSIDRTGYVVLGNDGYATSATVTTGGAYRFPRF